MPSYRSTLQHTAAHCNTLVLKDVIGFSSFVYAFTLQHATTHCNTLQHAATRCNTLALDGVRPVLIHLCLDTAAHCNTLQHTTTLCNTLQHSATHHGRRKSDFKSLRLPKFRTSFHGSPYTFQTSSHGSPQNFNQVFTGVNKSPRQTLELTGIPFDLEIQIWGGYGQ